MIIPIIPSLIRSASGIDKKLLNRIMGGDVRVIALRYASSDELYKPEKRGAIGNLIDNLVRHGVNAVVLFVKPIGLMAKILNYFIGLIASSEINVDVELVKEVVISSPYVANIRHETVKNISNTKNRQVQIISRIISGETFLILNEVREVVERYRKGKILVILDDVPDLVMTMGNKNAYVAIRSIALYLREKGGILLLIFPENILPENEEQVFLNLADEIVYI